MLHLLHPDPGRARDQETRRRLEQGRQGCGGNPGLALYPAGPDVLCIAPQVITWGWDDVVDADNVSFLRQGLL